MFAPRPVPAPVDAPVPATPDDGTVVPFLDPLSNRRDVFPDDFTTSLTPDVGWTLGVAARPGEHATLAGFLLDARVLTNRHNLCYRCPHDEGVTGRVTRGFLAGRAATPPLSEAGCQLRDEGHPADPTTPGRDRQHDRHTPVPRDIRRMGAAPTSRHAHDPHPAVGRVSACLSVCLFNISHSDRKGGYKAFCLSIVCPKSREAQTRVMMPLRDIFN